MSDAMKNLNEMFNRHIAEIVREFSDVNGLFDRFGNAEASGFSDYGREGKGFMGETGFRLSVQMEQEVDAFIKSIRKR